MADKSVYRVLVDDNFHYMDAEYRYEHGTFDDCEGAVAACRRIVDEFLTASYRPGMRPDDLWAQYLSFGDDPFVLGPKLASPPFSAWRYARERCTEICRHAPDARE